MAKKKTKKKKLKKKGSEKKDSKKKDLRKKDLKKKDKKDKLKKVKKQKAKTGKLSKTGKQPITEKQGKSGAPEKTFTDQSSNHNVQKAVIILKSLKSPEEVNIFTKGEKRLTVTRVIPAVLKRFDL